MKRDMAAANAIVAEPDANAARPYDGQRYLIGDTLYLRGPELGDAKWASAWRPTPFPVSAKVVQEQLEKEIPEGDERRKTRLIACRRDDSRPIGSAYVDDSDAPGTSLALHADPALGARGAEVQAEMLALLVPWLAHERHRPTIVLSADADLAPVATRAEALGMRPAVCLREGVWRDGAHHDLVYYEYLHPAWVTLLGDPGPGIAEAGAPVTAPRSPAPRREPGTIQDLPPNALIGSARLALRPMQVEDAETIANLIRAEPDASFGHSRFPYSAVAIRDWITTLGKQNPAQDVEFAVVLRETGELIGENGLYDVDWLARTAESGSWIYKPEYREAGYGTEAKHLLLEFAFERLGLHMIWSWVKVRNPRSQAALRKQGYRDAGRLAWTGFGPHGFEDANLFDLLVSEWRAARQDGETAKRRDGK
jgi:RimJ/RimL family protein N-acetyltransferase